MKNFFMFSLFFVMLLFTLQSSFGDLCSVDVIEPNVSCKMDTPIIICDNYNYEVYDSEALLVDSGNLSVYVGSTYYFNFSQDLGSYKVILCDGHAKSVIVDTVVYSTTIINNGGSGGSVVVNNYVGNASFLIKSDFKDKSKIMSERLIFNLYTSVNNDPVNPYSVSAKIYSADGVLKDSVYLKNSVKGVYTFDYDFGSYVEGDYFLKFEFDGHSKIIPFTISNKTFLEEVKAWFYENNVLVVWKVGLVVLLFCIILGLLLFILLTLTRRR